MKNKNSLFYSQAEYLNFALHNNDIEVYEIVEPKGKKYLKEFIYAIVDEITKTDLEDLKKCGFDFFCINPHKMSDENNALWIQFRNSFD